jgi:flagellar basal body L-ring protein FlgH
MRTLLSSTAVFVALALTGCATDGSRLIERPDAWRAAMPELDAPTPVPNGSIYQSGQDIRLFENSVARRVGDTLMIRLHGKELRRVDPGADDRWPEPADGEH